MVARLAESMDREIGFGVGAVVGLEMGAGAWLGKAMGFGMGLLTKEMDMGLVVEAMGVAKQTIIE